MTLLLYQIPFYFFRFNFTHLISRGRGFPLPLFNGFEFNDLEFKGLETRMSRNGTGAFLFSVY